MLFQQIVFEDFWSGYSKNIYVVGRNHNIKCWWRNLRMAEISLSRWSVWVDNCVALSLLAERFRNPTTTWNARYRALVELSVPSTSSQSLRKFYNDMEMHLRRQVADGQSVQQELLIPESNWVLL